MSKHHHSELGQLLLRVMPGKERPAMTKREKRELRYILRRHCYVNELSKSFANEKAVLAKRLFELTGLLVENIELPDLGGEASLDLEQMGFDPFVAQKITGPEVHQIAEDSNYFGSRITTTVTAYYSSPQQLAERRQELSNLAPHWIPGNDKHSAVLNGEGYRSLCQSKNVPFPEPAIIPVERSIKWMKPAKDPKPPRRSSRIREMIDRYVEDKDAKKRRNRR